MPALKIIQNAGERFSCLKFGLLFFKYSIKTFMRDSLGFFVLFESLLSTKLSKSSSDNEEKLFWQTQQETARLKTYFASMTRFICSVLICRLIWSEKCIICWYDATETTNDMNVELQKKQKKNK